jgi:two-component system KDP operon response regulator KdpE
LKVLVIDDEPQIRRALKVGLERNGYGVVLATSGAEGLELAAQENPDLVLLDLAMPDINGFDVCTQLRTWSKVPIMVVSVRHKEEDKIRALDCGADDYLTKPFGVGELLARLRALLRRTQTGETAAAPATFSERGLVVDFDRRIVTIASTTTKGTSETVHLTPKEYDLLVLLIANANRVLTHRQLLTRVWGLENADDHHLLRAHIANLRNKIEKDPTRPEFIQTETRVGYRFVSIES